MLEGFEFSRFSFRIEAEEDIVLPPYKGSTFRGGFGVAMKRVVCVARGKSCDECILKYKCIYSYIFETPTPKDTDRLKGYTNIPHPFVIEPPDEPKRLYRPGETITFNLVLIGRAIEYLPYFIYTFEELGKQGIGNGRGKYTLKEVCTTNPSDWTKLYSREDKTFRGSKDYIVKGSDIALPKINDSLTLKLVTPLRLMANGSIARDIDFHHIFRSALRRISNLMYFHCDKELCVDFKGLIERAEKVKTVRKELSWYDWERYSFRQSIRINMGGLTGTLSVEGELGEFLPFIALGEYIHIGKGTSFGLGKIRIIESESR